MSLLVSRRRALAAAFSGCVASTSLPRLAQGAPKLPASLRCGFNLPDQVPLRAGHRARIETLRGLRDLGMTHVRLPVAAENLMSAFSGPATVASGLDDVARAVDELLGLGYVVSVAMFGDAELGALLGRDPDRAQRALSGAWRRLARHLARWPAGSLHAELLNEPPMSDEVWRPMAGSLAKEVRAELPEAYVIIGPAPYQALEALTGWEPFEDKRIIYACHYYSPMLFTHQGADWEPESPWGRVAGVPFPSRRADPVLMRLAAKASASGDNELARELHQMAQQAWDAKTIRDEFSALGEWSMRHSATVIINEFGVLKEKASVSHRLAWLAATRKAAESQGFGWAHWDYSAGFGLLDDRGEIDKGVMAALFDS